MADRVDVGWAKELIAQKQESRVGSFATGHQSGSLTSRFNAPAAKGLGSNPAQTVVPAAKPKKRFGFL